MNVALRRRDLEPDEEPNRDWASNVREIEDREPTRPVTIHFEHYAIGAIVFFSIADAVWQVIG